MKKKNSPRKERATAFVDFFRSFISPYFEAYVFSLPVMLIAVGATITMNGSENIEERMEEKRMGSNSGR